MKIIVKRVNGKILELDVEPSDKILDLKAKLHELEGPAGGIAPERQRLIFDAKETEDGVTVSEYSIQDGTVLFMMPRAAPRGVEVTVKTLTGKAITLHVQRSEPVGNIKAKLRDKEGIPPDQQRLIFKGTMLEDHYTVGQYNIEDKPVLHLVVRQPKQSTGSTSTVTAPTSVGSGAVKGPCEVAGGCGLQNLGNTCFMNSTLQALSNTSLLREYFSSGDFKQEVSSSPLSMNGRLADCFADLLKSMWAGEHSVLSPHKLRQLVGEKRNEFYGTHQHDAQEFLTFLLDGLHEDVNRAPYPRPIVVDPTIDDKTDEQIAREAWAGNLLRNNSKIVEIFQFQVRSEIQFPDVDDKSLKFDPMMYLSLPLPKPTHMIQLTVLTLKHPEVPPMQRSFQMSKDRTFGELEEQLFEVFPPPVDLPVSRRRFVFAIVSGYRVCKLLSNEQCIKDTPADDDIWAFEVALEPELSERKCEFMAVHARRRQPGGEPGTHRFSHLAPPCIFAFQPGSTSSEDVISHRIKPFAERISKKLTGGERPLDNYVTITPMYSSEEGRAMSTTGQFSTTSGEAVAINFLVAADFARPEVEPPRASEASLPGPAKENAEEGGQGSSSSKVRLEQCLEAFTRIEELAQEDWAKCARTQEFERSLKKLDLWSLPKCLVIHLKRFGSEQLSGPIEKVETFIDAPMDLDLGRWLKGPAPECGAQYKLFAVVNHSGSLSSGHYTAYGRMDAGANQQWYFFNDSLVSRAEEKEVISQAAYILFYERCDAVSWDAGTHA